MLNGILDKIWQSEDPRTEIALELIKNLKMEEILPILILDIIVILQKFPTELTYSRNSKTCKMLFYGVSVLIELDSDGGGEHKLFVCYEDISTCVAVCGLVQSNRTENRRLSGLLAAFQIARDHSDGLMYLLDQERERRIKSDAQECFIDEKQYVFILANLTKLLSVFDKIVREKDDYSH